MGGVTDGQTVFKGLKSVFASNAERKGKWSPFHFILFTKFTPILLLILAGLIFWQRMNKEHINCYAPPDEDIRNEAVNQYCFVTGTYTITGYAGKLKNSRAYLPYPGIGPRISASASNNGGSNIKYHHYFQWVPFLLLLQAVVFSVPNLIWKTLQKDTLSRYYNGLMARSGTENEDDQIRETSVRFFKNLKHHSSFSWYFIASAFSNLIAVLFAFHLTDALLTGQFYYLGRDWLHHLKTTDLNIKEIAENASSNPLDQIFPKMSKCEFRKFGPGGGIINYDLLCVLTLNVLHDKAFLFLWFWFLMLVVIQSCFLLYFLVIFRISDWQFKVVMNRLEPAFLNELDPHSPSDSDSEFRKIAKKFIRTLGYNDGFLLVAISETTTAKEFTKFFEYLIYEYIKQNKYKSNEAYYNENLRHISNYPDQEYGAKYRHSRKNGGFDEYGRAENLYSNLSRSLKEMGHDDIEQEETTSFVTHQETNRVNTKALQHDHQQHQYIPTQALDTPDEKGFRKSTLQTSEAKIADE